MIRNQMRVPYCLRFAACSACVITGLMMLVCCIHCLQSCGHGAGWDLLPADPGGHGAVDAGGRRAAW